MIVLFPSSTRGHVCVSVYATTASNSHESSYACYYDEKRDTYLGDWYSVNWMEDSDVVGASLSNYAFHFRIMRIALKHCVCDEDNVRGFTSKASLYFSRRMEAVEFALTVT